MPVAGPSGSPSTNGCATTMPPTSVQRTSPVLPSLSFSIFLVITAQVYAIAVVVAMPFPASNGCGMLRRQGEQMPIKKSFTVVDQHGKRRTLQLIVDGTIA